MSTELGAKLKPRGQADGRVGVDAFGNGGTARLRAFLEPDVGMGVSPATSLQLQLCGKLTGQTGVEAGVSIDATDPVITLLENLAGSVGTSQLASAASNLHMDGARPADALNQLSNFSTSGLAASFARGGGASLANALPMPTETRSRIGNPTGLLPEAGDLGQSAIELLCDQSLRRGEFAAVFATGCTRRDEIPPAMDLINVIHGLDSFSAG